MVDGNEAQKTASVYALTPWIQFQEMQGIRNNAENQTTEVMYFDEI